MRLQAVIFDLDGVITDTAEYHYRAWQRLADEEGLPFNRQINEQLRGVGRRESLMIILAGRPMTEAQIAAMAERKNRYYLAMLDQVTPADLLPGAESLLAELHAAGLKIGIGSASKNAGAERRHRRPSAGWASPIACMRWPTALPRTTANRRPTSS